MLLVQIFMLPLQNPMLLLWIYMLFVQIYRLLARNLPLRYRRTLIPS